MKKDYFIQRMFYKLLVPSFFSSLGFALSDMADALVVGRQMGATGLAAISLCLPIYMLINIVMDGLAIGGSVRFSKKLGEGDETGASDCFNRIWQATLAAGVIIGLAVNFFAPQLLNVLGADGSMPSLDKACEIYMRIIAAGSPLLMMNIVFSNFLRNDNNEIIAAKGFLIGNITDIILNIIFVIVFDWGTAGAAISTVIGSFVAICCYLPGIVTSKANMLRLNVIKPDVKETAGCFKVGFSTSVQNLYQMVYLLTVNRLLMNMGGHGAVAVFDIMYNASFFIIYLNEGVSEASQPLISTFTGERSEEDCKTVLSLAEKYGVILSGIVAVTMFYFAKYVALMFGIEAAILSLAQKAVRFYCVGFAFTALNIIGCRYYQAKNMERKAFVGVTLRSLVVPVIMMYAFAPLGPQRFWAVFPMSEGISFATFKAYCKFTETADEKITPDRILRMTITNQNNEISVLLNETEAFCEKWDADPTQQYFVTLTIEELATSIIRNALKNSENGKIRITLLADECGDFIVNILDNAVVYNPFSYISNKAQENEIDFDEISVMLVKSKAKNFMHRRSYGFNSLTVRI